MTYPFIAVTAQLLLGAVWALAGIAKLAQGKARTDAVTEFGLLPPRGAALFGIVLPYAELALAAAFLTGACVGLASAASIALLTLFSAAMAANLVRGREVRCNCFGQLGRSPVSWFSVARNLALVGLALAAASATSPFLAIDSWRGGHAWLPTAWPPSEFLLSALCAAATLLGWQLIASAWTVAAAVAAAEDGPALGLPERRHLRRLLQIEPETARKG